MKSHSTVYSPLEPSLTPCGEILSTRPSVSVPLYTKMAGPLAAALTELSRDSLAEGSLAPAAAGSADSAATANGGKRNHRKSRDNAWSVWDRAAYGQAMTGGHRASNAHKRSPTVKKGVQKGQKASWQLGDAKFETPEMKAKRAALKHDPEVARALDGWWNATDADGNGFIDREEYIELGKALYRVIIADGNEVAAQQSAEDDWAEDSKGAELMTRDHYRDAIFQLCDLWTNGLESAEYVAFLDDLLAKMKAVGLGALAIMVAASPTGARQGVSVSPATVGATSAQHGGTDAALEVAACTHDRPLMMMGGEHLAPVSSSLPGAVGAVGAAGAGGAGCAGDAALAPGARNNPMQRREHGAATDGLGLAGGKSLSVGDATPPAAMEAAQPSMGGSDGMALTPAGADGSPRRATGSPASVGPMRSQPDETRAAATAAERTQRPACSSVASSSASIPPRACDEGAAVGTAGHGADAGAGASATAAVTSSGSSSTSSSSVVAAATAANAPPTVSAASAHVAMVPPTAIESGMAPAAVPPEAASHARSTAPKERRATAAPPVKAIAVKPIVYGADLLLAEPDGPPQKPNHWFYGEPPVKRAAGGGDMASARADAAARRRSRDNELSDMLMPPPEMESQVPQQMWSGAPAWATRHLAKHKGDKHKSSQSGPAPWAAGFKKP